MELNFVPRLPRGQAETPSPVNTCQQWEKTEFFPFNLHENVLTTVFLETRIYLDTLSRTRHLREQNARWSYAHASAEYL